MAIIRSVDIRNFKGAANVRIDLGTRTKSPIITLIGLNESGKTTLLEALSYFVSEDSSVSSIFEGALEGRNKLTYSRASKGCV